MAQEGVATEEVAADQAVVAEDMVEVTAVATAAVEVLEPMEEVDPVVAMEVA